MPSSPQIGGECNSIQSGWLYFGYETEILFWNLFYLPFYISQFFVFNEHVKWSRGVGGASGKKKKTCLPVQETQETHVWSLGWEDSPGGGNGNPLQSSCLENPMDTGAWWATVPGLKRVRHDWSDLAQNEVNEECYFLKWYLCAVRQSTPQIEVCFLFHRCSFVVLLFF